MEVAALFKVAFAVLFIQFCLSSSASAKATKVTYCDKKGNYPVKVSGVEISPDPVVSGSPATFKIKASAGQPISGGNVVIAVSYFGVHVRTETHNLCEETNCPIKADDFVLSHTQVLPAFTPPGSYTLKMTIEGAENKQKLTCISFNFKIGFGAEIAYG